MESKKELQVRISKEFVSDIDNVFQYGIETFGLSQAEKYENEIWRLLGSLSYSFLLFPECRYLPTKSKMYRWIILDSHLIIYRILKEEVQVLRMVHAKRSVTKIKTSRRIRL